MYRLLLVAFVLFGHAACTPEPPPNVVIMLADDQGWGDLSVNGNSSIATRNIDRIAANGAWFDRFYVSPVCSPTRAELLTGRYHPRSGVLGTSAGAERMSADESTLAEIFQRAGYATGVFGKWHNGQQAPYHPNSRGFDEFYGFASGHWGHYFSPPLERNNEIVRGEGYLPDDLTSHALAFMAANQDRPFLVFLPYNTPHSPMQVPDEWWNRVPRLTQRHRRIEREDSVHTRAALAMALNLDWNVGRVLDQLDQLELSEQTIVLYFSDNGPNGARWNDGMKGRKGSTDEGGVRSPLVLQWPGKIAPNTQITSISAVIDLLPTLADLAGIEAQTRNPIDGVSLKPLLMGNPDPHPERLIFSFWNGRTSVRSHRYRLGHEGALFDMIRDPGQRVDIAEESPIVAAQMRTARAAWIQEVVPDSFAARPFTVGHADSPLTHLPARDATSTGGITRSNRYPNDSFFHNWISPDDSIKWNVRVLAAGAYEAVLYYTCAEGSQGARIALSFGAASTTARVEDAHDPPLYGMADDRTPRIESYVKDFRPLVLGTLQLEEGLGTMTIRALEVPGASVLDFRLLQLRRVQ